jgi:uncharacterized repeat protein (TIGR03806 family)
MRSNAPRVYAALVPQVLALLLASCGGDDDKDPPAPPPASADTAAPSVPAGVSATAQSSTQISVTWTASTDPGTNATGVAGYRVYRDAGAQPIASVTTTTYTDSNLTPGTAYSYTVRAYDAATPPNESAVSSPVSASTPNMPIIDVTPPTVPAGVTAAPQSTSQILVSWTASTDVGGTGVQGYRVFRNGGAAAVGTVTTTNFTDTGLAANTQYSYTVVAYDAATPANVSANSTAAVATTLAIADVTPPTVPMNLTVTVVSSTSLRVLWSTSTDAGTGVAGYNVFRNGALRMFVAAQVPQAATLTFTDTGLSPATAYTYTVSAVDRATPTANESVQSASASGTTSAGADTTAPTAPTNVTATVLSATQIRIAWSSSTDPGNPSTGVAGYRVFRDGGATPVGTATTTTFTDGVTTPLTPSTAYTYTVRAFDGATPTANVSGPSNTASATTQASPAGLDARPNNTSCVAGAPPSANLTIAAQRVFTGLSFQSPVGLYQAPNDGSRWFVMEQRGVVRVFNNVANPTATDFVDITGRVDDGGEMGLLGMAFHPNFPADPRVYLSYTNGTTNATRQSRISEFRLFSGGTTLDPNSEVILLRVPQPADNHNGGDIHFGPDGYLYIGFGDGGGGGDNFGTFGNGQRLNTLLGKMVRIAVGAQGAAYTIPAGNPYSANTVRCAMADGANGTMCPEIYAYGFRNPWRWSFDTGSGELWLGDVGQNQWEEIDRVTLGGNYGWRCFEGNHSFNSTCGPNAASSLPPVAEVVRTLANSITGGYVYRGTAIPGLVGRYVFADFGSGNIWHIARDTPPTLQFTTAGYESGRNISSFGQDVNGEVFFTDYSGGLYQIVAGSGGGGSIPTQLSQTGCANPANPAQPASGMIPYNVNAPFWSDGATKSRWLALPNGQRITVATDNDFDFPIGSVLRKDFHLGATPIETRLFMRHTDGNWAGYTYQWNAQGTDATRVTGGLTTTISGQLWDFPSESQCLMCHTNGAGRTLGLEIGQLNGDFTYPSTGRTSNQIFTLNFIDTLTPAVTVPVSQLPVIPNPAGTAPVAERARAWLHSNCANCHRPSGGTPANLDLRYTTTLANTVTCDVQPGFGDLGIANARVIAPGDASRSVLIARVNRTGADMMPPLARHAIDTAGVALLTEWVNSLAGCN